MRASELFADIIDYPGPQLAARVGQCVACLRPAHPKAAELLKGFAVRLADLGTACLQEVYTSTFDMRADASLYVGHHLFREDGRRNVFMAQLSGEYRQCGFARGSDLPDHVAVILRFLAHAPDAEVVRDLLVECLIPAVTNVVNSLKKHPDPYAPAFGALLLWLQECAAESKRVAERSAG